MNLDARRGLESCTLGTPSSSKATSLDFLEDVPPSKQLAVEGGNVQNLMIHSRRQILTDCVFPGERKLKALAPAALLRLEKQRGQARAGRRLQEPGLA